MTVHRLVVLVAALVLACALVLPGCGSADTAITAEAAQLYPVMVDGKWGFIDNTGTVKIQPQFDMRVGSPGFSEGLAAVGVVVSGEPKFG